MSTNPTYIVTPLAEQNTVLIETKVPKSPFHDESHPVILQALTPESLPLMQTFLSGLSLESSWTSRESQMTAFVKEGVLPDGCTELTLYHAAHNDRPGPSEWYSLFAGEEPLLEIGVLNETLAHQIFDALLEGSLSLRMDPELVYYP